MQTKLTEAQKKLMPFRTFKKEFKAKVQAKEALSELNEKLGSAGLEVEKAAMMCLAAGSSQMAEDEVASTEKAVGLAHTEIDASIRTVDQKVGSDQAAVEDELQHIKDKANVLKKKCEAVMTKMKGQRAGIFAQQLAAQCVKKVQKRL